MGQDVLLTCWGESVINQGVIFKEKDCEEIGGQGGMKTGHPQSRE